jgi:hypothetical protein
MSNIQKCKSCKSISLTTPEPCVTQQCIQNTKCSEIIDAACIAYSGQDLLLCQEYELISKDDNIEVALQKLFAAACDNCAMSVEVTSVEGSYPSLTAAVTNGTGPYIYNWSIAQGPFVGHDILGATNTNTLDLESIGANSILANYPTVCDYVVLTNFNDEDKTYVYINCDNEQVQFTLSFEETVPEPICVKQWITPLGPNDAVDKFLNLKNNRTIGTPAVTYSLMDCDGNSYSFQLSAQSSVDICVRLWISTLTAQDVITYAPRICDQREVIKSTVVRLDVTDSKGCKKSVYYDFSCDCYVQTQEPEGVYTEYLGGNLQFVEFPFPDIIFLDRDDTTITCSELKSFGCISPTVNLLSDYRTARDLFIKGANCTAISGQSGYTPEQKCPDDLPLDYTPWEPGGMADQTIQYKGRLSTVNIDFGCPEYTFWRWNNVHYNSLNGDRIVDRLPTVKNHMVVLPVVNLISQIPNTGIPGEYVFCEENSKTYAWDPTLNNFDFALGEAIDDILTQKRAKRDAQLKAFNELVLAQQAFLLSADTFPLHRYKYELI